MGLLKDRIRKTVCDHTDWTWDYGDIPFYNKHPTHVVPTFYPYYDVENEVFVIAEWFKVRKCDHCGEWLGREVWKRETIETNTVVVDE